MQITAEHNVIGLIIIGEHSGELLNMLDADEFSDNELKTCFDSLKRYWIETGEIDIAAIPSAQQNIADICRQCIMSLSGWELYAKEVKKNAIIREVQNSAFALCSPGMSYDEISEHVEKIYKSMAGKQQESFSIDMYDGYCSLIENIGNDDRFVRTGFDKIDNVLTLERGDFVVLGGRPSSGKTAFSLAMAIRMSAQMGHKIAYFSLETHPNKLFRRIASQISGVSLANIRSGNITTEESELLVKKQPAITELPIKIFKASGKSVSWMRAEATRYGATVAMIDYLSLISEPGKNMLEKVTNTSIKLHEWAQQSGVVVLALSQLNRGGADKEPDMEDIRESGQVEQDADAILMMHSNFDLGETTVKIAKSKEGPHARILMRFDGKTQKFMEI